MCACIRSALIICLFFATMGARAQSQSQGSKEPTGSITGRVTVGGKPARDVVVLTLRDTGEPSDYSMDMYKIKPIIKTTTDAEGVYRFTNLVPGDYGVITYAPAFTGVSEPNWRLEKKIKVAEGETVEKIDFALIRGGVITGRVTDARGRPVIGHAIFIVTEDDEYTGRKLSEDLSMWNYLKGMSLTDDRGMYRLYGLPPGRYFISLKEGDEVNRVFGYVKHRIERETFHPGVTNRDKASAVEVKEGREATGIDIRLGLPTRTYKASGRIVDAETGKPVSPAIAAYGLINENGVESYSSEPGREANSKGEFQLDSLTPGKYFAYAKFDGDSEFYTGSTPFEISAGNLTDLTIKVRRGQTVSGSVVLEGPSSAEAQASLLQLPFDMGVRADRGVESRYQEVKIASDGSFRLTGMPPGTFTFSFDSFPHKTNFTLLRTERNGVLVEKGVQINRGENVSDIRIILAYVNSVIRGRIKSADDRPMQNGELLVVAYRIGDENFNRSARTGINESGEFKFERLRPGEYELTVHSLSSHPEDSSKPPPKLSEYPVLTRQRVTATNDTETRVTITVDANKKNNDE